MKRRTLVALAFIAAVPLACNAPGNGNVENDPMKQPMPLPPEGGAEFMQRYGEPDHVISNREGMIAIYRKEKVQILYLPTRGQMRFSKFQDPETKAEIDHNEVLIRMYDRDRVAQEIRQAALAPKKDPDPPKKDSEPEREKKRAKVEPPKPPRVVAPVLSAKSNGVTVTLEKGSISTLRYGSRITTVSGKKEFETDASYLIVKIRVSNDSADAIKYTPWHLSADSKLRDEAKRTYRQWQTDANKFPLGGVKASVKIEPGKSVDDVIVFVVPSREAEELALRLPGDNIGQPNDALAFTIPRSFFEKK